jgi:hypothetical protein
MTLTETRWDVARAALAGSVRALPPVELPVAACDRLVLAQDLVSLCPLPSFDTCAMDGWAVSGSGPWTVVGTSLAGRPVPESLVAGQGTIEGVEGAKLELVSSRVDALGEIPAYDIISASYGVFDSTMLPGKVLRRVYNPMGFAPYAMFKNDFFAHVDPATLPDLTRGQRRRQRRQLAKY